MSLSPRAAPVAARPYHHGHLKAALTQAGVELAREGGPAAIGVREAARRAGVSANASYRHFADLNALVQAVGSEARRGLARSMQAEIATRPHQRDPAEDAILLLHAVGRGYVHYALAEPGLFRAAFIQSSDETDTTPRFGPAAGDDDCDADEDRERRPYLLLQDALDAMTAAGLIRPGDLAAAATNAWAGVHGLSELLLGPMSSMPADHKEHVIDSAMHFVSHGLTRPNPS